MGIRIPFDPPLSSSSEAKSRLVKDYYKYCTPDFAMIILDPLCFLIASWTLVLGYSVTYIGVDRMLSFAEKYTLIKPISLLQVSEDTVHKMLFACMTFRIIEALYVFYICFFILKLKFLISCKWSYIVGCVSFPATEQVLMFVRQAKRIKKKRG